MSDLARHAVEEPRRTEILELLGDAPAGLSAPELAARLELHPNTVRWHLGRLADAGLVASRPVHRGRPGRPRIVYEATGGSAGGADGYRFLAEMLASAVAASGDGEATVERAGRAWGRHLVDGAPPASADSADAAVARIVAVLASHGFAPQRSDDVIEMHHCPFHDLVDTYGRVICGLHRGLLAGALETLDAGVSLQRLEPYPAPGVCRAHLAVD